MTAFALDIRESEQLLAPWGAAAEVRHFRRGEIIAEDRSGSALVFRVAEGIAARSKYSESGDRRIFEFIGPPHIFGLMTHAPCTIEALSRCRVLAWPRDSFTRRAARDPAFAEVMLSHIESELARTYETLTELGARTRCAKLAYIIRTLHDLVVRGGAPSDAPIPVSQADLADALGVTNVYISRVMKDLRDLGVVSWGRDGLQVRSPASLAAIAERRATAGAAHGADHVL